MMSIKLRGSGAEKSPSPEELRAKIDDVKKMVGSVSDKYPTLFHDASISRYLRARNWNVKRAAKMLKETVKWRLEFKPDKLRWDDVAHEARTGKIYKANYFDKKGRTVLVVRPDSQNKSAAGAQIRHLVYSLENAVMTMNPNQEQLVWLIDCQFWTMPSVSVKVARETLKILQDHYPERLGVAILYNPPKAFASFWTMMKPFIEPKTFKKVNFVYSNKPQSRKIMEDLFHMDKLDSAFGGRGSSGFDFEAYELRMKQDDQKFSDSSESDGSEVAFSMLSITLESQNSESSTANNEASDEDDSLSQDEATSNLELDLDDEEIPDQPCTCENNENDPELDKEEEQACRCKEVGNYVEPDKETQDQPCSYKDDRNDTAAEMKK